MLCLSSDKPGNVLPYIFKVTFGIKTDSKLRRLTVVVSIYLPICLHLHGGHRQAVLRWRKARAILDNSVGNHPATRKVTAIEPFIDTGKFILFFYIFVEPMGQRYVASSLRQPHYRLSYLGAQYPPTLFPFLLLPASSRRVASVHLSDG